MKKNLISVVSVLVLVVVLSVTYVIVSNKFADDEPDIDDIFGTVDYLWQEKVADIDYVDYDLEDCSYTIRVGDKVTLEGYESQLISSSKLKDALMKIAMVSVKKRLNVSKDDFAKYGFDESKNVITLRTKAGITHTLVIGNNTGVANEVYILDKEGGNVCTVTSEQASHYTLAPESYCRTTVTQLNNAFIRKLSVSRSGEQIMEIVPGQNEGYIMNYPYEGAEVSNIKIAELLSEFYIVEADAVVEENPRDIGKYGLSDPLTVYLEDSADKHTFRFGDKAPEGGIYMMYGESPVVYRGSFMLYDYFKNVDPVSYLSPYVHRIYMNEVSSLAVTSKNKSYTLAVGGTEKEPVYTINSKKVNASDFSNVFNMVTNITYGVAAQREKAYDTYCSFTFTMKDGTTKEFTYEVFNDDYCIVTAKAGIDALVLRYEPEKVLNALNTIVK